MSGWVVNISKDGDSTAFLVNLFYCVTSLTIFFFFLIFFLKWNFLYFNLCSLPVILSLGTTEKSLVPSSLLPTTWCLYTFQRSAPSLLLSRMNRPSLSASPPVSDAPIPSPFLWHFTGLAPICPCLPYTRKPETRIWSCSLNLTSFSGVLCLLYTPSAISFTVKLFSYFYILPHILCLN